MAINKIKHQSKLIKGDKARSTISKTFSLSFQQLGLNKEMGTMVVFVVAASSTIDSWWSFDMSDLDQEILIVCACVC